MVRANGVYPLILLLSSCLSRELHSQSCKKTDAPAPPTTGAEHILPESFVLSGGSPLMLGQTPDAQTTGQVRVVVFSAWPNPAMDLVNWKYTPTTSTSGVPGIYHGGLRFPGGPPLRQVQDGYETIGVLLPGKPVRFRLESCQAGSWVPVTSPELSHTLAFSSKYLDDVYTVTLGPDSQHRRPGDFPAQVVFTFQPRQIKVHTEVSLGCKGIPHVVAYSSDTVKGSVVDDVTGQPVTVKSIGVSMLFDGTTEYIPASGHGSLNFPGTGEPTTSPQPFVDRFPYGRISKSADNVQSLSLDDQSFGIAIGGPCRPFSGVARVILYDGRIIVNVAHTP